MSILESLNGQRGGRVSVVVANVSAPAYYLTIPLGQYRGPDGRDSSDGPALSRALGLEWMPPAGPLRRPPAGSLTEAAATGAGHCIVSSVAKLISLRFIIDVPLLATLPRAPAG